MPEQAIVEQQISPDQNNRQKMISSTEQTSAPPIDLGSSKLSDYRKISVLGKGTYGEVYKCIHTPTGLVVAMKTFLFEVSPATISLLNLPDACRT